jgi:Putative zinc-finger
MADIQHPRDALHEALDGRLNPAQRADLERHLAECERCRHEMEVLRWTKAQVSRSQLEAAVPPDLEARIRRALDDGDRIRADASGEARSLRLPARLRRWWPIAALATAGILLWIVWSPGRLPGQTLPEQVDADYRAYRAGQLTLAVHSTDVADIEAYFRRVGIPFRTRVFDLRMMKYDALGGLAHQLDERTSALFVYRGPDGRPLVCQMYQGLIAELPAADERLTHQGFEFLVYRRNGLTLVFWQEREGGVMCVLVGDGDPRAVIQLAFAKAVEG